jgi:hypothetical protein
MATLPPDEVFFGQPHPFAGRIGLPEEPAEWIRRLRGKSDVYGERRLWDVTAQAPRWIMALRPHPERVVTTKNGGDLHPKGYRNNLLANSWNRLVGRVREDIPDFPRRSCNKLRNRGDDSAGGRGRPPEAGHALAPETVQTVPRADIAGEQA